MKTSGERPVADTAAQNDAGACFRSAIRWSKLSFDLLSNHTQTFCLFTYY